MRAEDREAALNQLADLEATIEELDALGVDVDALGLRRTAGTVRRELERDDRAETIEAWLRSMPDGEVISYRVRFPGNRTIYDFAAVKHMTIWYTTARQGTRQYGSRDLARWMAGQVTLVGCVRMRVAANSDKHRRPDVEMGDA